MKTPDTPALPPGVPTTPKDFRDSLADLPFHKTPHDRQLIRTTFKLSQEALEARAWLAGHHKISMTETLSLAAYVIAQLNEELAGFYLARAGHRDVRRTLILTKGALGVIEAKAAETGRHRDEILEAALQAFSYTIGETVGAAAELHRQVLPILGRANSALVEAEAEMKAVLEPDDPVLKRFGYAIVVMDNLLGAIEDELEDGTPVDPDDF